LHIPDDAVQIDEYYPQTYAIARVYSSQRLIARLPMGDEIDDPGFGEESGTFVVAIEFDVATNLFHAGAPAVPATPSA
jgi:hypothetical protein